MKAAAVAMGDLGLASSITEAKRSKGIIAFTADISGVQEDPAKLKKIRDAVVGVLKDAEVPGRLAAKRPE